MDTAAFLKRYEKFKSEGLGKYVFPSNEDIILTISALRGEHEYALAIELYEKYEAQMKSDDLYEGALLQVIYVCMDTKDIERLKKYAGELRAIDPNIPTLKDVHRRFGI